MTGTGVGALSEKLLNAKNRQCCVTGFWKMGPSEGRLGKLIDKAKAALKWILRHPADALIASSRTMSSFSGKFYPYQAGQTSYILLKSSGNGPDYHETRLPIPPQDLWEGYGATITDFLNSGKVHVAKMHEIFSASDFLIRQGNRVLDLGCAAGRMIRWFDDLAGRCEVWGVDISAPHITWCQQYLSPPFNFATVTTAPCLPFEDKYFDLIYCGSVFTHIDDLAYAWLLELKRILRPGGRIYITVHDRHTANLIMNHPEKIYEDGYPVTDTMRNLLLSYDKKENFTNLDFCTFTILRGPQSQVFYDIDYLRCHWGRILNVLSVTEEAYGYQTAILLE